MADARSLPFFEGRGYEGAKKFGGKREVFVSMRSYARLIRDGDDDIGYVLCASLGTAHCVQAIFVPASAIVVKKIGRGSKLFLRLEPRIDDEGEILSRIDIETAWESVDEEFRKIISLGDISE